MQKARQTVRTKQGFEHSIT